jgi:hypothetical protein
VTKEHVFAKWIREEYGAYFLAQGGGITRLQRDKVAAWSYSTKVLGHNVNAFCATCNNGWMSRLEVECSKIMRPMLRARQVPVRLGFVKQRIVSSWAVKTAYVLHQLHPTERFIPESEYRTLAAQHQPSSAIYVTIGARHVAADRAGVANIFEYYERFISADRQREDVSHGVLHMVFVLGAVCFAINTFVGVRPFGPRRLNLRVQQSLSQIWPTFTPEVTWPPLSITDIGGAEGLFEALVQGF